MQKTTLKSFFFLLLTFPLWTSYHGQAAPTFNLFSSIPHWVKKVGAQQTPEKKKVYLVNNQGAVNDGQTMNTSSIQKTIDRCAEAGGGIVTFKKGTYLTGSIFVKSGVTLKIPEGVQIIGSQNIKDYPIIPTRVAGIEMKWPAALINVQDQNNVKITGKGIIDGRGKPFWDKYWDMRKVYEKKGLRWAVDYDCKRPRLLLVSNSKDVTLEGLHLQRSGFWTVHILYSNHITINGLKIENNIGGHGPSTDGIDIDSSTYVLVENCDIDCNDDNYCLKAGRDADGLRVNRPTEYVVIRHCIARSGGGLCTFGSETSGGIHHILVEDSKAIGTSNGINFKSAITRGGTVKDVYIQNLKLNKVRRAINLGLNWNPSYSYTKLPKGYDYDSIPAYWKVMLKKVPASEGTPTVKDISISNIRGTDCNIAIHASGIKTSPLQNFKLKNIDITADKAGKIEYAKNWRFKNVHIHAKNHQKVKVEKSTKIRL